ALEQAGHTVVVATTGEQGLRLVAEERPQVVIVDGQLPGISGATVVRRLKLDPALGHIPCFLLTASDEPEHERQARGAGADVYLRKDGDLGVLVARVEVILRSAPTAERSRAGASLVGPKKVLAVDDSLTYLEELASQLRAEGYEAVLARSGEEALDLL